MVTIVVNGHYCTNVFLIHNFWNIVRSNAPNILISYKLPVNSNTFAPVLSPLAFYRKQHTKHINLILAQRKLKYISHQFS